MKKFFYLFLAICTFAACQRERSVSVEVRNPADFDRNSEIVEVPMEEVAGKLQLADTAEIVILDETGQQIPYQITFDNRIIFPASVKAGEQAGYTIKAGTPELFTVSSCGKEYPEAMNDIAWENDRMAFRICGATKETTATEADGYDLWVKNSEDPVLDILYESGRMKRDSCRSVPALGAGTTALYVDNVLVYPGYYQTEEILDNGPLRFTVMLTYHPFVVKGDSGVVETRVISLDKGSQLNKTIVYFKNLKQPQTLATGIELHEPDAGNYFADAKNGYIGYADRANPGAENGVKYVGAVFPSNVKETRPVLVSPSEADKRGVCGHLVAFSDYLPDSDFVYYWGAGWSEFGFSSMDGWTRYLNDFARKVRNPMVVTLK